MIQVIGTRHPGIDTGIMGNPIPIELDPRLEIEVDAALIASGMGLDIAEFQRLMEQRKITVLCERGTGEDAGLYRASYYYKGRRVRLVVDIEGNPVPGRSEA